MPYDIQLFQVLTVLFCLGMIGRAVSQYRRGRRSTRELIAWIGVWGVVACIGVFPRITDYAAEILGLKSGSTTFIFFLLILLIYLTMRSIFALEQLEEKMSKLARRMAIKEFEEGRRDPDVG